MNYDIYHLRNTRMDDKLTYQLSGIIYAYRPHDCPPSRHELEQERVDKSHCSMVELAKDIGINYHAI